MKYKNLSEIDESLMDEIVVMLAKDEKGTARERFEALLGVTKDKRDFEVFHLSETMMSIAKILREAGQITRYRAEKIPDGEQVRTIWAENVEAAQDKLKRFTAEACELVTERTITL